MKCEKCKKRDRLSDAMSKTRMFNEEWDQLDREFRETDGCLPESMAEITLNRNK